MSIPAIQLSFSTYIYNSAAQSFINFWNRFFYFVSNSLLIFIYISLSLSFVCGAKLLMPMRLTFIKLLLLMAIIKVSLL